ncbi:MAG TPA: hypothetical protein PLY87_14995 [Planctomycetaceae bacterium]|nr:hypothetical protein [Planctomycetaceae bacterium]HQZ66394.1 hypothetical protein [Planctomycetaceae bacterium]HRA87180.1 hypothetical protein [Planctomycetaceae bacterium]
MSKIISCSLLRWTRRLMAIAIAAGLASTALGQQGEFFQPLNEKMIPGFAADTLARARQYDPSWLQPVRVELPTDGTVSVYSATPEPAATIATPAQFCVNAGHIYRLRIADMPEFPNVEVYPSIEILDRMHPPEGRAPDYPIPVVLTEADIREAIEGHMVTRVVYLELPQLAATFDPLRREIPQSVDPTDNALQEAGRLGRPMIIVRIGGRIPTGADMPWMYYGSGGAFDLGESVQVDTGVVKLSDKVRQKSSIVRR